jgi:hypothetical protein
MLNIEQQSLSLIAFSGNACDKLKHDQVRKLGNAESSLSDEDFQRYGKVLAKTQGLSETEAEKKAKEIQHAYSQTPKGFGSNLREAIESTVFATTLPLIRSEARNTQAIAPIGQETVVFKKS